jgi:hypothetical protein
MADEFQTYTKGLESPATEWASLTAHDSTDFTTVPRAIDCTTGGSAVLVSASGATVTVTLTPGIPYPARPVRINATGTEASGLVGLW